MQQPAAAVSAMAFRHWRLGRRLCNKEVAFLVGMSDEATRAYESAEQIPARNAPAIAGIDEPLGLSAAPHVASAALLGS